MIHKLQSLKVRMPLIIIGLFVLAIAVLVVVTQVMVTNTINKVTYSGFDNTVMGYASLMDTWFEDQLDIAGSAMPNLKTKFLFVIALTFRYIYNRSAI